MRKFFAKYIGVILVIAFSLPTISPFFAKGFFPMHDDTQVVRVYEMAQALKDGNFPVRWTKDLGYGYGYPLFNFYAPLAYYAGGFINLIGFDALTATKMMMVIGILIAGIFMYFLAREFWGEIGGIVAGSSYVYAPYHALDIYVRGDVAEFWAYAFIPLAFYGLWKTYKEQKWMYIVVASLGYAGIILSHNLTAMMVTPFLIMMIIFFGYALYKNNKLYAINYTLYAFLLGLGLSAFYWLPALSEMSYTNVASQIGGGADFRDHFVCIQQLWESSWGFGGSVPGCTDGLSFSLGKIRIVLTFLSLFLLLRWDYLKRERIAGIFFGLFVAAISIFMILAPSKPIWEFIPLFAFLQYPWRFLLLSSFAISFLIGSVGWFFSTILAGRYYFRSAAYSFAILFVILLLFSNGDLFHPQYIYSKQASEFTTQENIRWATSKISDEYMPKYFVIPKGKNDIVQKRVDDGQIITDKTNKLVYTTIMKKEKNVLAKIAPFPAWQIFIDGKKVNYLATNKGIEISVLKGKHTVSVSFVSTDIEKLANGISIVSILFLFAGILWFHRYEKS